MTLILVKEKRVPDFGDGLTRGAVIGQLYTLFHTLGDLEMDATLTGRQQIMVNRAAKTIDRLYTSLLNKNKKLAARQRLTPLEGKRVK